MNINEVQVNRYPLVLATPIEVDSLENSLWITFPFGYREYVTQLGQGCLNNLVRIYPPWEIEKELTQWRQRINNYWLWDTGRDVMPKERALECVVIGDTLGGDELVFHPGRPNRIFLLPHDDETIFEIGPDLFSAIEWLFTSELFGGEFESYQFEPFDSREDSENNGVINQIDDPEGQSLNELLDLGRQWAKRHSVQKLVSEELKKYTNENRAASLHYEGLLWEGDLTHGRGYVTAYQIIDVTSKLAIGTFHFHKTEYTYGTGYVPNKVAMAKLRPLDQEQ